MSDRYELEQRLEKAEWVLNNAGFRRCDIAACNCGSWHQVGGFKARFDEIKEAVEEADYSTNGKILLDVVKEIIAEAKRSRDHAQEWQVPSKEQLIRTICGHALCDLQHAQAAADAILSLPSTPSEPAQQPLRDAVQYVIDKFKKDEAQGYHTRDRQFAIEILDKAPSPAQSSWQLRLAEQLADVVMMLDAPDAYNREYIAAVCRSILSSFASTKSGGAA